MMAYEPTKEETEVAAKEFVGMRLWVRCDDDQRDHYLYRANLALIAAESARRAAALSARPASADVEAMAQRLGYHHEHPATASLVLRNPDGPEAAAMLRALSARAEKAERERDEAKAWGDRLRKMLSGGQLDLEESERGWKRRAEAAEAESARLREALEKIVRYADRAIDGTRPCGTDGIREKLMALRDMALRSMSLALSTRQGGGE